METFDFVVVGTGIFGLAAAKTFHQLEPKSTLAILDSGTTVGGVWAEERLYPGLKTNNMLGTFEYPDFPMRTDIFGVKPGEHMPGEAMLKYLTKYAEKFDIFDKIRFRSAVTTAEHQGTTGGWILTVQNGTAQYQIFARKLVMAAGLTSDPFLPHIEGQEKFGVPLFHSGDFVKYAETLDSATTVTIFGGTKSAWDIVYAYASKGVKVNWVIRASGHGPIWISPPYVTPLKKWLEKLVHTRLLTWFSPCIWGDVDGYGWIRRFYHGSAIGRAITNAFWSILGNDVLTLNKYDSHPETKKLKPWSHAMFTASSFSILNYPTNIFDLVRDGTIKVHIADLTGLSERTVHLSDGTQLDTDALCCVTGWKHVPPVKFLPEGIEKELGLPRKASENDLFSPKKVHLADGTILSRFPQLRDQPVQNEHLTPLLSTEGLTTTDAINPSTPLTPWTLYRFIVPPSERLLQTRDIAFAGMLLNFSTTLVAHAQAVWIAAYFRDQLSAAVLPPLAPRRSDSARRKEEEQEEEDTKTMAEVRRETRLHARFGRWRYPAGHGTQFPDFVFDGLPYVDLLVNDLGLKVHRKGGWFAEMTEPYGPEDYRDLVAEFVTKVGGRGG